MPSIHRADRTTSELTLTELGFQPLERTSSLNVGILMLPKEIQNQGSRVDPRTIMGRRWPNMSGPIESVMTDDIIDTIAGVRYIRERDIGPIPNVDHRRTRRVGPTIPYSPPVQPFRNWWCVVAVLHAAGVIHDGIIQTVEL